LAHELRNPLAPIRNAVQVLRLKEESDPDLKWAHEVIERQVRQMARLLDDLLDVSRITRNKLELRQETVGLASVVESAIETSCPLIRENRHQLFVHLPEHPVTLEGDPVRLAQVLSNLLNNAAKYTDPGGNISIEARVSGGEVHIAVRDTGIGIAPEMMPHLFDIFSQANAARERAQGGLGIGLSLVKGLVELHHGSVEAHSEGLGCGSEFAVRLPLPLSSQHRQGESIGCDQEAQKAFPRLRIVVADDNKDAADSVAMMLRIMGNEVRTDYDGEQAVRTAQEFRPDLVILDIGMPNLNGYQAARRVRDQNWGKDVYLVAMTGWGQREDRRKAEEAGFNVHMVKPADPSKLMRILEQLPLGR
jgi:CheY-like chemotaxis protein/two-component sensor histidine kinase